MRYANTALGAALLEALPIVHAEERCRVPDNILNGRFNQNGLVVSRARVAGGPPPGDYRAGCRRHKRDLKAFIAKGKRVVVPGCPQTVRYTPLATRATVGQKPRRFGEAKGLGNWSARGLRGRISR